MAKTVVRCYTDVQREAVVKHARGTADYGGAGAESINVEDGCHSMESWYRKEGYTIIQYDEFERVYLKKEPEVINKYQIY